MSRRIFAPLPRLTPLTAGNGIAAVTGPILAGSPGFRPVIARPQLANHGGGGGVGGHGGGGHHGGHHASGPSFGGPGLHGFGGGGRVDAMGVIGIVAVVAFFLTSLALIGAHEYAALVILMSIFFGVPLAGVLLLFLLLLLARGLSLVKRSSRAR